VNFGHVVRDIFVQMDTDSQMDAQRDTVIRMPCSQVKSSQVAFNKKRDKRTFVQ